MNKSKHVFTQLVEFLDYDQFRHIVDKYRGNRYVKQNVKLGLEYYLKNK